MCPDRDLVSAYVDGEVPSPWKERLEEHFASCADCSALVERYRSLGSELRSEASVEAELAAAQERGRVRLDSLLSSLPASERPALGPRRAAFRSWGRSVTLPIPFAAAAAILVLLLGGATAAIAFRPASQGLFAKGPAVQAAVASGEIAPALAQPASMDELLRYLDSSEGQITLTINLPTGTTFGSAGKPVIMRAGRTVSSQSASLQPVGESAP